MTTRWSVCPKPGCTTLISKNEPCPTHSRPKNASWSPDRDRHGHFKLRMTVIKARGNRCERCGWQSPTPQGQGLALHHVRPGDRPENVQLLCGKLGNNCHAAVDGHAR